MEGLAEIFSVYFHKWLMNVFFIGNFLMPNVSGIQVYTAVNASSIIRILNTFHVIEKNAPKVNVVAIYSIM